MNVKSLALTADDEISSGVVLHDGLDDGAESFPHLQLEFLPAEKKYENDEERRYKSITWSNRQ